MYHINAINVSGAILNAALSCFQSASLTQILENAIILLQKLNIALDWISLVDIIGVFQRGENIHLETLPDELRHLAVLGVLLPPDDELDEASSVAEHRGGVGLGDAD